MDIFLIAAVPLCNCSDAGISCLLKGLEKKLGVSLTKVMELFDMGC